MPLAQNNTLTLLKKKKKSENNPKNSNFLGFRSVLAQEKKKNKKACKSVRTESKSQYHSYLISLNLGFLVHKMEVSMISHLDRFKVLIKSNICKAWPIEDGL